jgi:dihydroorotase/N-acyl-D-amino-acid deacylase
VTTEITGEGESAAPVNDEIIKSQADFLQHFHLTIDWRDLDGYFRRFESAHPALNLGTYMGAATARVMVLGRADRAPNAQELAQMQQIVETAMRQGAMGVSSALIYAPGAYAKTDELVALAKVAARHGGIYASHIRNEGDAEQAALDEVFRIAREAQIPCEIFHLKVAGRQNWGKMRQVVSAIQNAREQGLDVTADQYPYVASATSLGAVIPPKYHEGGTDAFVARLKDPGTRAQIERELNQSSNPDFENMWHGVGGPSGILIVSVLNPALKQFEGETLAQIAQAQNKPPLDALLDFVIADHDNTGAVYFEMSEPDVRLAMLQPWVSVGSDYGEVAPDGPLSESKSHPRAYGSFTRILGRYVREEHVLSLADAVRKFTSLPAQREKLRDRGMLRVGYFADVTIFDPEKVIDIATFEDPNRASQGIEYVFVNGLLSVEHEKLTGQTGGRALRGPGYFGVAETKSSAAQR